LEIWSEEVRVFAGSRIPSQTCDLGKIVITFSLSIKFDFVKNYGKKKECSYLGIMFRAEG